ncbi:hypothetical protein GLOIN_2v1791704 [Rhizophagus irregularis DAOM 181602=DAOM 197198]|uniref:Uncharacterized protein n=1 Tax=Rhizophagus irregularis (strain DAOM 197198w) TaxID=1432141 RepID=A0A015JN05_RHIIW|nr:hypothetical protein RirG_083280 [Rhizophagus irregularis DAOM 197198w]GBC35775.2 hypothetical protein GLOIN_2v1791704 [Rhizophagus irregularis DAOM 181602=DAOM 197198]
MESKIERSNLFKDERMLRRLKIETIRWMNDMFRFGGTVCKDCEEEDINEVDDRLLKEQAGIIDSEESGEKSDNEESEEDNTDDSEKTGEILSPDEIWDENIENFNEEENLSISKDEEMSNEESDESNDVEETETTKIFEEIIRMDLKRMGYDVEITEIERIRKFGVTAKIITTYEFMKKYLTIWNLEDKELDEQILQWRVENTKECERCEIERLKKEFKIGKETCIECEKDIEKENPTDDEDEMEENIKGPEIGSSKN